MRKSIYILALLLVTTTTFADSLKCNLQYGDPTNPEVLANSESVVSMVDNNFITSEKRGIKIESLKVVNDFFYRLDLYENDSNECYTAQLAYGEAKNSKTWINSYASLCPGDEFLSAGSVLNGTTLVCSIIK